MAKLQLPAPPSFQPHGNLASVVQRWTKWKKRFEYFLKASGNIPFERSVFHSTMQHKGESIEQFVTRLIKLTLYCEYRDSTEKQISRSSHSHLQFHKTKKEIIGRVRPHIRESIRTYYGTSSASFIHHRTEINTVNL